MVFGIGFNKLWQGFTGKAPGVSLYDWLHPEENQPAEMPESPASGATGTDGSIGAGDSAGTGGTDEASGAKGDDGVAESDEEGEGETSTTGDSDAASAAEASGSNSAETDNDNDGDGRPDDDGTTPIHEENGSYVPLVGVTGGRLGREQAQRDGDAIDVARGADVTNPLDGDAESGGGGGGVTGDATGGGHDAPSRIAPAGLETQSVRHVGFRLAGGGTLDPVALAVLAGIRG